MNLVCGEYKLLVKGSRLGAKTDLWFVFLSRLLLLFKLKSIGGDFLLNRLQTTKRHMAT